MTVHVILDRATTIVSNLVISLRHHQRHTEARQERLFFGLFVDSQLLVHHQFPGGRKCIGQLQLSLQLWQRIFSHHLTCHANALFLQAFELVCRIFPCCKPVLQTCSVVVVSRSAPEVRAQRVPLFKHRVALHIEVIHPSCTFVESNFRAAGLQCEASQLLGLCHPLLLFSHSFLARHDNLGRGRKFGDELLHLRIAVVGKNELLTSHALAYGKQLFGLVERREHLQHLFAATLLPVAGQGERHLLLRAGLHGHRSAGAHLLAVVQQLPAEGNIGEILEEMLIEHLHLTRCGILQRGPDVLIIIGHLVGVRIGLAVRAYQAVAVEVVVRSGIASKVAAVGIDFLALLVLAADGLIHEVPDEAALVFGIFAHQLPILGEATF